MGDGRLLVGQKSSNLKASRQSLHAQLSSQNFARVRGQWTAATSLCCGTIWFVISCCGPQRNSADVLMHFVPRLKGMQHLSCLHLHEIRDVR